MDAAMTRLWTVLAVLVLGLTGQTGLATAGTTRKPYRVAIWRIDALGGVTRDIGTSLETMLTQELGLLTADVIPSSVSLAKQKRIRRLRQCQGENRCLGALARLLRADFIVAGSIASLAASYVVSLKLVDRRGKTVRRFSQPFTGQREKLIEAVRIAAYKLVAPDRVLGSLQVVVDHPGAEILVDGKKVGVSPLRGALTGLKIGAHNIAVRHPAYLPFTRTVQVRFQKTTRVMIHLVEPKKAYVHLKGGTVVRDHPIPFYSKWWFWTTVSVAAVALGALSGWAIGKSLRPGAPKVLDCDGNQCSPGTLP